MARSALSRSARTAMAVAIAGGLAAAACTHHPGPPVRSTTTASLPPLTTTTVSLPPLPATTSTTTFRPVPRSPLDGTSWVLVPASLGVAFPDGVTVTAAFAGRRVTGSSGCNTYFGDFAGPGLQFGIGNLGGTDRACEEAVALVEATYLERLDATRDYVLIGDDLRLSGSSGNLAFRRAGVAPSPTALLGDWLVTGVLDPATDAVRPARSGAPVLLGFDADGLLYAKVCLAHQTNWSATGNTIVVAGFPDPDTNCSGPDGQPQDEADLLAAVWAALTWQVEGDTLTLYRYGGGVLITATRAPG